MDTLAGAQEVKSLTMANLQSVAQTNAYRDLSGATLVEHKEEGPAEVEEQGKPSKRETSSEADEDIPGLPDHSKGKAKEKSSILGKLKGKIASVKSTLGKRGRDVKDALERGKEKLQSTGGRKSTRLSIMETKQEDVYDEEDDDMEGPPKKKFKQSSDTASPRTVSTPMRPSTMTDRPLGKSKSTKPWMGSGLFVGQDRHFDARLTGAQNKKKRAAMTPAQLAENRYLPLPMFSGEDMLTTGRTFRLPWDVYNPLPPGQPKPDEWRKAQANRVVGDAVHVVNEWRKFSKLPVSHCECTADTGCHDHCLNRIMSYECNSGNCKLGHEECGNRAFADLKERVDNVKGVKERSKEGKKYDIGVEVVKTHGKGFGVRASRTFDPGQIIVEYAGEIITVEECDRRMVEEYKDNTVCHILSASPMATCPCMCCTDKKQCYYLMNFVDKLIIDASRTGSIARFVNHSCEPNCSMIQWTVAGKPRMALFAGDAGISTGEELTYDYNFDNFNDDNTTACACGAEWCRGVLGKKPTEQAIKRAKSQKERERLVAVKMEMERVEAEKREKVNGKKRKKHVGWAYVDAHGNDVEPPVEESEEEEKPAKKQRLTATITEKVKDGEVGRSRSVLRKKKLVGK